MPTWKAYFTVNGEDFTRYPVVEFFVPDDLFLEIAATVADGTPLRDCDFYDELLNLAEEALDLRSLAFDWLDGDEIDEFVEDLNVESCVIDDPGDIVRLEEKIRGLRLPSDEIDLENEVCTRRYRISVILDEDDRVEEVTDVRAEGVSGESARSVSTEPCYPDYEYIAAELKEKYHHV